MINTEIKAKYVDVVQEDGTLQRMELVKAIEIAEQNNEDVVSLNNKRDIPVVKMMNYSKYMYEKKKKEKDNKKKSRLNSQDIKEIQLSDVIAEHDLIVKAHNIDRLLNKGNKVKVVITYRGRAIRLIKNGVIKLKELESYIVSDYDLDKAATIEGNKVYMLLSPCKTKKGH